MGYIHCCGDFVKPEVLCCLLRKNLLCVNWIICSKCPVCGHTVIQLTRIDDNNNLSSIRYINKAARIFWNKCKSKIIYERRFYDYSKRKGGSFYLNYNEFGVKKRCYSNFSNLKLAYCKTFKLP